MAVKPSKNPNLITYQELLTLARTANPTARGAVLELLEELDESDMTIDELDNTYFSRPTYDRGDGSEVLVGKGLASQYEDAAQDSLASKGVSTGGGGGGGGGGFGGGYSEEITSEQWQRIRSGEIDIEEAEWENDPDNYDPETGEMYEYGYYPDEDEDDEFI